MSSPLSAMRPVADAGNTEAQFVVGRIFLEKKDGANAAHYFRRAAECNHAESLFYLGCMLREGYLVNKDLPEAVRLCQKAANLGHADAQLLLAAMYGCGSGVAQSIDMAHTLCERAAAQGLPAATEALEHLRDDYADALMLTCLQAAVVRKNADECNELIKRMTDTNVRFFCSKMCLACASPTPGLRCKKCRIARFCGPDCMASAFSMHKVHCKQWSK